MPLTMPFYLFFGLVVGLHMHGARRVPYPRATCGDGNFDVTRRIGYMGTVAVCIFVTDVWPGLCRLLPSTTSSTAILRLHPALIAIAVPILSLGAKMVA